MTSIRLVVCRGCSLSTRCTIALAAATRTRPAVAGCARWSGKGRRYTAYPKPPRRSALPAARDAITTRREPSSMTRCSGTNTAKSAARPAARAGTAAVTAASYVSSGVSDTPTLSTRPLLTLTPYGERVLRGRPFPSVLPRTADPGPGARSGPVVLPEELLDGPPAQRVHLRVRCQADHLARGAERVGLLHQPGVGEHLGSALLPEGVLHLGALLPRLVGPLELGPRRRQGWAVGPRHRGGEGDQ